MGFRFNPCSRFILTATEKLADDLLVGFALAFIGGGVGGVVGKVVGDLMKESRTKDFMVDGIKDMAKFAVRGPGAQLFRQVKISPIPSPPFQWYNAFRERVAAEFQPVLQNLYLMYKAVMSDDDSFDANFDPNAEVDRFNINRAPLFFLPLLNDDAKARLQRSYEAGWLKAWIEKKGNL